MHFDVWLPFPDDDNTPIGVHVPWISARAGPGAVAFTGTAYLCTITCRPAF